MFKSLLSCGFITTFVTLSTATNCSTSGADNSIKLEELFGIKGTKKKLGINGCFALRTSATGSCQDGMKRLIEKFNEDKKDERLTESQKDEKAVPAMEIQAKTEEYIKIVQQKSLCDFTCGFSVDSNAKLSKTGMQTINCGMQPAHFSDNGNFVPIDMGEAHCTQLKKHCVSKLMSTGETKAAAETACYKCYGPQDCRIGGVLCGKAVSASADGNVDNEVKCDAHYIVRSVVAQCGYKCHPNGPRSTARNVTGTDRFVCPPPNCRKNSFTGQDESCETSSLYQNPVALMFVIMGSALIIIAVECGIVAFGKAVYGSMCASDENAKP